MQLARDDRDRPTGGGAPSPAARDVAAGATSNAHSRRDAADLPVAPLPACGSSTDDSLAAVQQWLQRIVTHPSHGGARVADEADASAVGALIRPSARLSSGQRLAIYAQAYWARLIDCLRVEFPVLLATVGDEAFDALAREYLAAHPSRSYTLAHLADAFAEHLQQTRPPRAAGSAGQQPDWADLLVDLARFELAVAQAFDAPGPETQGSVNAQALEALSSDAWLAARLVPVDCLRLLELRFPLGDYYGALRSGRTAPLPAPGPSYVVLSRRNYIVRRHEATRAEYELLAALVRGQSVGEALTAAIAHLPDDQAQWSAQLGRWFRHWSAAGLFCQLEVQSPSSQPGSRAAPPAPDT